MSTTTRSTFTLIAVVATVAALTLGGGGIANAKTGSAPAIPLNNEQALVADTGASGFLSYTISNAGFCYTLDVRHLSSQSTVAHIHSGSRNVVGPPVVDLVIGSGPNWITTACAMPADKTVLAKIMADPRGYYVNVHSENFRAGEIRGQLK